MVKEFAPDYDRTEQGWVKFPNDAQYRKRIFPDEAAKHPAKSNVFMVQAIIEYVSEIGQILLDPMAGTGTLMVGALMGRDIICVEINPYYCNIQQEAIKMIDDMAPGTGEHIVVVNMPLQNYMPIPDLADHIIFSPPYASVMKSKGTDKMNMERMGGKLGEYSFSSPLNLGLMNDFIWGQEMELTYLKCYQTLKAGGTMTLIIKDHYEKQKDGIRKRIPLTQAAVDACKRVGFRLFSWQKWLTMGAVFTQIYRSRGWATVDDEDIVSFRR